MYRARRRLCIKEVLIKSRRRSCGSRLAVTQTNSGLFTSLQTIVDVTEDLARIVTRREPPYTSSAFRRTVVLISRGYYSNELLAGWRRGQLVDLENVSGEMSDNRGRPVEIFPGNCTVNTGLPSTVNIS